MASRNRVGSGIRRRAVGVVVTAAVVLIGMVLAPGVAVAGGPTSVLLASPSSGLAAALYHSDPAYDRLMALLDATPVDGSPPQQPTFSGPARVNVTWMVHDVGVWRTDQIMIHPGGTTISTRDSLAADAVPRAGESLNALPETSHPPADPAALHALLTELGLFGVPPARVSPPAAPAPATAPAAVADPVAAERDSVWWWAAAGALVGAGALAIGLRTSTGLRRRLLPVT